MDIYQTTFSNAILTSVFAGIISTLLCFAYYIGYKEITDYPLSSLINVSSLIFVINTFFLVFGFLYYLFLKISKRSDLLYIIVMVTLTALSIWAAWDAHRSANPLLNLQFHQLLTGILAIVGVCAFAGIPFLFHNKRFNEEVL